MDGSLPFHPLVGANTLLIPWEALKTTALGSLS